jgi:hypothetical protein
MLPPKTLCWGQDGAHIDVPFFSWGSFGLNVSLGKRHRQDIDDTP